MSVAAFGCAGIRAHWLVHTRISGNKAALARVTSMSDLYAAQAAVHDNTPPGWFLGQPGYEERCRQWSMHAFDTAETPADGKRSGEWTAVGRSELRRLRVMARCLAEIKAGRWPE